jgi:hypothetical protein
MICCLYSIAIYKAAYPFGGYMSDVIAAVDQVQITFFFAERYNH